MSSITWTPTELASSRQALDVIIWRAVEARHLTSTLALVDTLAEQTELERLLEDSKPPIPGGARHLHYLLGTPFRYPPLPRGSRFRAAIDPGVFYGADAIRTACAEVGYWTWRFLRESPQLKRLDPSPRSVFSVRVQTHSCINLLGPPFAAERSAWTDPSDYTRCQRFARTAREAATDAIRYESVRDPEHGPCVAVLHPAAFASAAPLEQQGWQLIVTPTRVWWIREVIGNSTRIEFDATRWS